MPEEPTQNTTEIKKSSKPAWIGDFDKRIELIKIISDTFESNCTCTTCVRLRKVAHELEGIFMPKGGEQPKL